MDLQHLKLQLDHERRTLALDGETIEVLPQVTRHRSGDGTQHMLIASSLTAANADAVIAEQIAHYRAIGSEFEWKVYAHDEPPDLLERLARHGFSVGPLEAVLVADATRQAESSRAQPGVSIVRVTTAAQVVLFRDAAAAIFGKDYAFTANELLRAIETHSTQHLAYLAMEGDIAVSVGRLYTHPQSHFGGLYGGGTRASHRGRGLYRALVAARAREARELGARCLIVDALPTSRPILERLGFVRLSDTWPCVWSPTIP